MDKVSMSMKAISLFLPLLMFPNMVSAWCSTRGQYITLDGVGECHSQTTPAEFKQEEHVENATHIYSRRVSIFIILLQR